MENRVHAIPDLNPPIVDVRDIALAQVHAIDCTPAVGRRINVHHNHIGGFRDVCMLIKKIFGSFGYSPPSSMLPNAVVHSLGMFVSSMANLSPMIGYHPRFDTSENLKTLQVDLRPIEQTICDMGHQLIEMGIVERKEKYLPGFGAPVLRKKHSIPYHH
jgi:nucleoside-diphosphate-sugar epimerase